MTTKTEKSEEAAPLRVVAEESPPPASVTLPLPSEVPPPSEDGWELDDPALYLNRELTWLSFHERVLFEAEDERTPLLDRVRFLAIVGMTLDEFHMKRIGGLKQQIGAGMQERTVDGRTPREQLELCSARVHALLPRHKALCEELKARLADEDIHILSYSKLTRAQQKQARALYIENVFPLVTPQTMDPAHPFPFISNQSLNLLVTLGYPDEPQAILARVKVPIGAGISRFVRVGDADRFVPLEDVMAHNLDLLFPDMEVRGCELFRVTRNANTETDEDEADDLLEMIESELRERKFAPIVRLQVSRPMDPIRRGMLAAELGLDPDRDVDEIDTLLGLRDIEEIANLPRPDLQRTPHHPLDNPELLSKRNIFNIIRDSGPLLLHHPYDSFSTSVERFLAEASSDPKVRAIKMTLYRTSSDSPIIGHLINAAQNGKQVAVVVELKARFDERANIRWASRLERVGIHVTYGVVGLKTHCKVVLVVRQDYAGLRRYCHFGTGNYHSGTARHYDDLGMFTCDNELGADVTQLFNYLTTGLKPRRSYKKLLVAPKLMKNRLIALIERESEHARAGRDGLIRLKMNALEDVDITRALYGASRDGVRIEMMVRDTCRLRPGLPGLSENVNVVSIVGRFLEHARILHFRNGGEHEYYIGSADMMRRNLTSRVETLVPVEDPALQEQIDHFIRVQLEDRRSSWEMKADGSYVQRHPEDGGDQRGAQERMISWADARYHEATRLKKRRTKGLAKSRGTR